MTDQELEYYLWIEIEDEEEEHDPFDDDYYDEERDLEL